MTNLIILVLSCLRGVCIFLLYFHYPLALLVHRPQPDNTWYDYAYRYGKVYFFIVL